MTVRSGGAGNAAIITILRPRCPSCGWTESGSVTLIVEADPPGVAHRRRRRSRWAVRDINRLIVAKDRSEQRWSSRNEHLIKLLDNGQSVKEIALVSGRSERQIRVIREQLNDMRAVA